MSLKMLGRDQGLVQAQVPGSGEDLAVEVGEGKDVAVRQEKAANAQAGQKHGLEASQSPQADDEDAAPEEPELLLGMQGREVPLQGFGKDARGQGGLKSLGQWKSPGGGPGQQIVVGHDQSFPAAPVNPAGHRLQKCSFPVQRHFTPSPCLLPTLRLRPFCHTCRQSANEAMDIIAVVKSFHV